MISKYEHIISESIVEAILYLGMNANEINDWTNGQFYKKFKRKNSVGVLTTPGGKEIEIPIGCYIVKNDNDNFSAIGNMVFDDKYIIVK